MKHNRLKVGDIVEVKTKQLLRKSFRLVGYIHLLEKDFINISEIHPDNRQELENYNKLEKKKIIWLRKL